jgi:hypothetical protein
VKEREAYEALDWLLEAKLESRTTWRGGISRMAAGARPPLSRAHYGHSRDHRSDRLQIVYGLLCTREGLPIAVEVFEATPRIRRR